MAQRDDKRLIRNLKRSVKKAGNRHRRQDLKRQLRENPDEAHLAEEDLGGNRSETMNGLDRPRGGAD